MTSEFTIHYTQPLVRSAVLRFWRRAIGGKLMLAVVVGMAMAGYQLRQGDRSWEIGVFGTVVAFGALMVVFHLVAHYRRSMWAFRRLKGNGATIAVSDTAIRLSSEVGATEFSWNAIREVWRYPDLWLLVFSRNMFATLPLAGVPAPALDLIQERVSAAGGRVA